MGRKNRRDEYTGWMEGQDDDSAVRAGEARPSSARGVERRVGGLQEGKDWGKVTGGDRKKIAEILSSAGVDAGRVAVEILYLLPEGFVREYERLFHDALTTGEEGRGGADEEKALLGKATGKRVTRAAGETMGGAKTGKKAPDKIGGRMVVRNAERWGEKQRVDRELRKLARGMAGGRKSGVRKCYGEVAVAEKKTPGDGEREGRGGRIRTEIESRGCGKWLEGEWQWCPYCGMRQVAAEL